MEAGWNKPLLMGVFRRGLNSQLQAVLVLRGHPKDLDSLVSLATKLDSYLNTPRASSAAPPSFLTPPHLTAPWSSQSRLQSAGSTGALSPLHHWGSAYAAGASPSHCGGEMEAP